MKTLVFALVLIAFVMPASMRCLADGSVNVNLIIINCVKTLQEAITRSPQSYTAPAPQIQPTPAPRKGV